MITYRITTRVLLASAYCVPRIPRPLYREAPRDSKALRARVRAAFFLAINDAPWYTGTKVTLERIDREGWATEVVTATARATRLEYPSHRPTACEWHATCKHPDLIAPDGDFPERKSRWHKSRTAQTPTPDT